MANLTTSLNPTERHLATLIRHGARILVEETGAEIPLTEEYYSEQVSDCQQIGCCWIGYLLRMNDIDEVLGLRIWRDGHIDSGSRSLVD